MRFWPKDAALVAEAERKLSEDLRLRAEVEIYAHKPLTDETIVFVNGQALQGVQEFTLTGNVEDGLVELTLRVLPERLRIMGDVLTRVVAPKPGQPDPRADFDSGDR